MSKARSKSAKGKQAKPNKAKAAPLPPAEAETVPVKTEAVAVPAKAVEQSPVVAIEWTRWLFLVPVVGVGLIYYFSNQKPQVYFDYTGRIAGAFLQGRLGLTVPPPSWLSEMVPFEGYYYSVFPLGAVLSQLPVAWLQQHHFIADFPALPVVALIAGAISYVLYLLASHYDLPLSRRWLLVLLVPLGTWMWCNLAFAGAWQIALGLAMLGELGALYFILVRPHPLVAGFFFALAFGNRTEIIVLSPLMMYLAGRKNITALREMPRQWPTLARFSVFPFILGVATLAYNYARFHSPFDFGYARIPGVLQEPWYRDGIFSVSSIWRNMNAMLFQGWRVYSHSPYLTPNPFGGSIFLSCPFLIFLFRRGARDSELKMLSWVAIALLTLVLWLHGNPGGWQFSYRYSMVLLPWMFLLLLENSPQRRVSVIETVLFALSLVINAYVTYLFLWTDIMRP